jgi:hypothetical protein
VGSNPGHAIIFIYFNGLQWISMKSKSVLEIMEYMSTESNGLHRTLLDSTRLQWTDFIRLHQIPSDSTRLHQTSMDSNRLQWNLMLHWSPSGVLKTHSDGVRLDSKSLQKSNWSLGTKFQWSPKNSMEVHWTWLRTFIWSPHQSSPGLH